MKKRESKIQYTMLAIGLVFMMGSFHYGLSQDIRWLRVGQLQAYIIDYGAEPGTAVNTFSWPAQYGDNQYTSRSKTLWIGAANFHDPVENKNKVAKVVGAGPLYDNVNQPGMIFSQSIKLIGRSKSPTVVVDNVFAADNQQYDQLDEEDPNLPCDRMVVVKFNTSIGISVTKKVMAFTQQNHDSYYIHDYVFKNTGIYNAAGDVYPQTLHGVWLHFGFRYAFSGVTTTGWGSTWGSFDSEWGSSSNMTDFGRTYRTLPADGLGTDSLRGCYAYYSPNKARMGMGLTYYDQDWGCPNQLGGGVGINGVLGSAKYAGTVTLFASAGPNNFANDDPAQPATSSYFNTDNPGVELTPYSQYDDVIMQARYTIMSEGHLAQSMEQAVGTQFVGDFWTANQSGRYGGLQGQGYGPYTLAPGDSVHIVYAEGANGISWEKCREVGAVWYEYYKGTSTPSLILPSGGTAATYTDYTKAWVQTGKDSLLQVFRRARDNYRSGYNIPRPPDPPSRFTVSSGGEKIALTWNPPSSSPTPVAGYVIYRSESNVKGYLTIYKKVFECPASVTQWDDTTCHSGFKYFYYIQSKDDGSRNDIQPGVPLFSSLFYTLPSKPAYLLRPPGNVMPQVRVVPNPYDIRSRKYQFADRETGLTGGIDQISFYDIPPVCKIKIFSENGTLIREIDHTNTAGSERWDSKTSSGQLVVSGIYILYVIATEDYYAKEDKIAKWDITDEHKKLLFHKGDKIYSKGQKIFSAGQSATRKFVVIR
jgi:hypothetical protein